MQCRNCGTDIADKAIICYRCGAGTMDPIRRPAALTPRRGPLVSLVVAVLMILLGLYLGQASRTAADPGPLQVAAGVLTLAAVSVLIVRIIRRR